MRSSSLVVFTKCWYGQSLFPFSVRRKDTREQTSGSSGSDGQALVEWDVQKLGFWSECILGLKNDLGVRGARPEV